MQLHSSCSPQFQNPAPAWSPAGFGKRIRCIPNQSMVWLFRGWHMFRYLTFP